MNERMCTCLHHRLSPSQHPWTWAVVPGPHSPAHEGGSPGGPRPLTRWKESRPRARVTRLPLTACTGLSFLFPLTAEAVHSSCGVSVFLQWGKKAPGISRVVLSPSCGQIMGESRERRRATSFQGPDGGLPRRGRKLLGAGAMHPVAWQGPEDTAGRPSGASAGRGPWKRARVGT